MVWDPPKQQVNITRMMIYSLIPILNIYSAWRIQIFWLMVAISIGASIALYPIEIVVEFPYYLLIIIPIDSAISLFVTRHYAKKYNNRMAANAGTQG